MARPRKQRCLAAPAQPRYFKPQGIPASQLQVVRLQPDEMEALRLVDQLGLQQIQAAESMQVSRQTLANILKSARNKLVSALLHGHALEIVNTSPHPNQKYTKE